MNAPTKNLLTFIAALVLGVFLIYVNGALGFLVTPLTATAMAFCAGFCVLVFGKPHINPRQGLLGWGLLGLAAGFIAPFVLLMMLYAG